MKKPRGRGMARASLDLIAAMREIAKAGHPMTGRGVGYKLFVRGLIPSMGTQDMQKVYRLLKEARERGIIPWNWITDETRDLERTPSWDDPAEFAKAAAAQYRRDFWSQQPVNIEVWSEKGTVRGVIDPVLREYGVGFRVMHGFSGATTIYDVARSGDGRPLVALYVGDYDPSGLFMSERDLPDRLLKYGGHHVGLRRVALRSDDLLGLPSFPAADKGPKEDGKGGDPRYKWFVENFGHRCWELDAMDPNDLRDRIEREIVRLIEPSAWERCSRVNEAERESLSAILSAWGR